MDAMDAMTVDTRADERPDAPADAPADDPVERWHDAHAHEWDERMYQSPVGAAIREAELRAVLDHTGPLTGLRVLDAATGTGRFAGKFLEGGAKHVTGVDVAAKMLDRARARLGTLDPTGERFDLARTSIHELDLEDAAFDLVCSVGAIEHVAGEKKAIAELARVLRPGGRIILATASGHCVQRGLVRWLERRITGLPKHLHRREELAGWLDAAGVEMERASFCGVSRWRGLAVRIVVSGTKRA